MLKPCLAQLLMASGYTTFTPELIRRASASLYGNIGAGLDCRDWDTIMASDNPLQASEDALIAIYQGSSCLLDNADHLQDKGYSANMIEWTTRQLHQRLGIDTYDPSWADGTWMEPYAQKTDTEVYNDAKADVPNPPPPVTITTNAAPFDTTDGTGMASGETADSGTDNTIEIAAAAHFNGSSVVDGVGGTNTVSLIENVAYDLTQGDSFSNVSILSWSNNVSVTVDAGVLGAFGAITGAAGAGDQLILDEDANFDFSTTALTGVETVATASATAGKTYTFDAADLNDVTTVIGQTGVGQTVALSDAANLSGIDFTDIETLTFGTFIVNIDTGNLATFNTITGAGAGTLDLSEDADYDFRTTALTGVSSITATGVTGTRIYYFNAADLNDVTAITGTSGKSQSIVLSGAADLSEIDFADMEALFYGAYQVDISADSLDSFNNIYGAGPGSASILNLKEDADYDFSSTAILNVPTITALNATAGKTYTFDAADLQTVTAIIGTNGQAQIVALNHSDDLSSIDFTDMETLSFGNFLVIIDAGNFASFNTITGGGAGTLNLIGDADYDFSTKDLSGISTITTTGANSGRIYTFDSASLDDVTNIAGEVGVAQTIVINDSVDLTGLTTTNIETIYISGGVSITNSNNNTIKDVTTITGSELTSQRFLITADATISNDIDMSGVTQTNLSRLSIRGNSNINNITGTSGDDWIIGTVGADTLNGGGGNDTFYYDYGNSGGNSPIKPGQDFQVNGGEGDGDRLFFNNGNGTAVVHDIVVLDADFATTTGMEILYLNSLSGFSNVTLGGHANVAFANGIEIGALVSSEYLRVDGSDVSWTHSITATGTNNNDTLIGGSAADILNGGAGADTIRLGAADAASDVVIVASGDTVASTAQVDNGAAGLDDGDTLTFANGVDTVAEFEDGNDFIDSVIASADLSVGTFDVDSAYYGLINNQFVAVRGTYESGTRIFTTNSVGTDMFVAFDQNLDDGVSVDELILLGSGGATITIDDFAA